jgi:all-trans-retinol 13,14-reductase
VLKSPEPKVECDVKEFDAAIVGSGLSGLAAARYLDQRGMSVVLLEKSPHWGGHLRPFERGGVRFEVGLHYIADGGTHSKWQQAMDELAVALDANPLETHFESFYFPNTPHRTMVGSFQEFVNKLKLHFPSDHKAIERYQRCCDGLWDFSNSLDFPLRTKTMILAVLKDSKFWNFAPLAFLSLEGAMEKYFGFSRELSQFLTSQHLLMGAPPEELSSVLHLLVHRYYFEKAFFPDGGGQRLMEQLRSNTTYPLLTSVDCSIQKVTDGFGVKLSQLDSKSNIDPLHRHFIAKNILWSPDPRDLVDRCHFGLPLLLRARLASQQEPAGLCIGFFATRESLQEYEFENQNVWLIGTRSANKCYDDLDPEVLASTSDIYISSGSLRDPGCCPDGNKLRAKGVFQAMFLCSTNPKRWDILNSKTYQLPESKGGSGRRYREKKQKVLDILSMRILKNFPKLQKQDLIWTELGTPFTHSRFLNSRSYTGYGYRPTVSDLLWKRPSHHTGVNGLYLIGAHTKPSHGITTALLSGFGVAKLVHRKKHK